MLDNSLVCSPGPLGLGRRAGRGSFPGVACLAPGVERPLGDQQRFTPQWSWRRDLQLSCCSVFQEHTMFPPLKQPAHPWKTHPVLIHCSTNDRKIQPMGPLGKQWMCSEKEILSKPRVTCFFRRPLGADAEETFSWGKRLSFVKTDQRKWLHLCCCPTPVSCVIPNVYSI